MDSAKLDLLPATPMWQQYSGIKRQALDALLLYRMGDFYELFLDDAVEAAEILGIALTARHKDQDNPVAMCGVPFHSATNYINKLLAHGKRVAICEQTSDPAQTKGIVKREIVRIVSPGMAYDNDALKASENNFLCALTLADFNSPQAVAGDFCALDISTGECSYGSFTNTEEFAREVSLLKPREFLVGETTLASPAWRALIAAIGNAEFPCITSLPDYYFNPKSACEDICRHFGLHNLEAFELTPTDRVVGAIGAAFRKTKENQRQGSLCHLREPRPRHTSRFLAIDERTFEHLDVFPKPDRSEKESLLYHVDRTLTAMGARELRALLQLPLRDLEAIEARQGAIAAFHEHTSYLDGLRDTLRGVRDLERLVAKIGLRSANPRDLIALKETLMRLPYAKAHLERFAESKLLASLNSRIQVFENLVNTLATRLKEDAPAHAREGGIFTTGWHKELDELIALSTDGVRLLNEMEEREKTATGIASLKIRYNRVFGYYIEVTKTNLKLVPEHYIRKQTTANGERFVTEELRAFEEKVLRAEEKRIRLESALFEEILGEIAAESQAILRSARELALVDALQSLAQAALEGGWTRPELVTGEELEIREGRHPVVEQLVGRDRFVANDIAFDKRARLFLVTGPNMAGKSTFMRQVALLTLLAHTGSFIPAASARIGLVDRIASRVGASDRIGQGQSTFMVEMNEIARILRQASPRSLLVIDEIGRGTSTFDGLALAWAILEDIQSRLGCRALFATHYHELTSLEDSLAGVRNLNVLVREEAGAVAFLHKVAPGRANGSYGIEVAKLAGVPGSVLQRAEEILSRLEKSSEKGKRRRNEIASDQQMSFFGFSAAAAASGGQKIVVPEHLKNIETELLALDLDRCTPLDALLKIKALKERLPGPAH